MPDEMAAAHRAWGMCVAATKPPGEESAYLKRPANMSWRNKQADPMAEKADGGEKTAAPAEERSDKRTRSIEARKRLKRTPASGAVSSLGAVATDMLERQALSPSR